MPIFATDTPRFSGVIKHEHEAALGYCREAIVLNDTAATLLVGTVLGKVTATGKYKVARSAAVDGSQVPSAILIADYLGLSREFALAAATDTKALVIVRGPAIVAGPALQLGTGTTLAVATAALTAAGIVVEASL